MPTKATTNHMTSQLQAYRRGRFQNSLTAAEAVSTLMISIPIPTQIAQPIASIASVPSIILFISDKLQHVL